LAVFKDINFSFYKTYLWKITLLRKITASFTFCLMIGLKYFLLSINDIYSVNMIIPILATLRLGKKKKKKKQSCWK